MDALTCSLAALLLATAVGPGHQLPVVVQDDALLLNRAPAQVQQYTDQIAAEGASDVRLTASWSGLAPSPTATKKPAAPFDASDSKTYPVDGFRRLDTAVKAAAASGLDVELDLAFWAPRWAVPKASDRNDRERYMPKPAESGLFAQARARRYSGAVPRQPEPVGRAAVRPAPRGEGPAGRARRETGPRHGGLGPGLGDRSGLRPGHRVLDRCDRGLPSPCALRRQRDLPHERPPADGSFAPSVAIPVSK